MKDEKKETNNLKEEVISLYKSQFVDNLPITFGFSILIIATLAIGVFFPYALYIIIPLFILPLSFAYTLSISDGHKKGDLSNKRTVTYFISYFHAPFYGSYRVIKNFLLSLVFTIIFSIIYYFVLAAIFMNSVQGFTDSLNTFSKLFYEYDYNTMFDFINNNEAFLLFLNIFVLGTSEFFFINFFLRILNYSLNPFFRASFNNVPTQVLNYVFTKSIRAKRKEFLLDLFKTTWWLFLLFLVFNVIGIVIGWLFLLNYISVTGVVVFGLTLGFISVTPFLSYYVCLLNLLNKKYQSNFINSYIKTVEETFLMAKDANELSEEESNFIENEIEKSKQKRDEIEKENKNENDDNNHKEN